MRLELGAGGSPTEGFEHADARPLLHIEHVFDMVKDPFPFAKGSVKHLLMHQTLEHFTFPEAQIILHKCREILELGGMIQLSVPNMEGWLNAYATGHISWNDLMNRTYGNQDYDFNCHKWGYTQKSLSELLRMFRDLDFNGTCWTDIHVKGFR